MKLGDIIFDRALLIKSTVYGDRHRILSFLTADHGRVDLIAYGALGSKKRFGGTLDFLNLLQIQFQVSRGDLNRLLQCDLAIEEISPSLLKIKRDYVRTVLVLSWFKLIAKMIPRGGGQDLDLFPLLQQSLKAIENSKPLYIHLVFLKNLLSRLGYLLDLSKCLVCHSQNNPPFYFKAEGGGLHCNQCFQVQSPYRLSSCVPNENWTSFDEQKIESIALNELEYILLHSYQYFLGIQFECFDKLVA